MADQDPSPRGGVMDEREAWLRRQVEASQHDPSNGEVAIAWAVAELDRLRGLLVKAWRAGAFMFDGPGADALSEELAEWARRLDGNAPETGEVRDA